MDDGQPATANSTALLAVHEAPTIMPGFKLLRRRKGGASAKLLCVPLRRPVVQVPLCLGHANAGTSQARSGSGAALAYLLVLVSSRGACIRGCSCREESSDQMQHVHSPLNKAPPFQREFIDIQGSKGSMLISGVGLAEFENIWRRLPAI